MNLPAAIWLIGVAFGGAANAQSVSVKDGNVFITTAGKSEQLTSSAQASDPSLSPDGQMIAFVRATPERKVETGSGNDASEIWVMRIDGSNPTRLVEPHSATEMKNVLGQLSSPQFSTDGRRVFFETTAFATSGAIHVVEIATRKEHFICAGNELKVVRGGEYRDCLLVQQHRYFIGGGSYDWFWLLRPDGKEVGPVGEDTASLKETFAHP